MNFSGSPSTLAYNLKFSLRSSRLSGVLPQNTWLMSYFRLVQPFPTVHFVPSIDLTSWFLVLFLLWLSLDYLLQSFPLFAFSSSKLTPSHSALCIERTSECFTLLEALYKCLVTIQHITYTLTHIHTNMHTNIHNNY